VRCDVLAVGTELLLGQIVDSNSAWIGEQLAVSGIDSYEHRVVGDNEGRMVDALRDLLSHADAVIVCGGLGPTQDDITRDAIAAVMGVPLVRRPELVEEISAMFSSRGRDMPESNLRQADVPVGGAALPNPLGTAPGLCCPVGNGVVYAVPGVPYEMRAMVLDHVMPGLLARSGEVSALVSRSLKTWGTSESALSEMVASRVDALEARGPIAPRNGAHVRHHDPVTQRHRVPKLAGRLGSNQDARDGSLQLQTGALRTIDHPRERYVRETAVGIPSADVRVDSREPLLLQTLIRSVRLLPPDRGSERPAPRIYCEGLEGVVDPAAQFNVVESETEQRVEGSQWPGRNPECAHRVPHAGELDPRLEGIALAEEAGLKLRRLGRRVPPPIEPEAVR